MSAALNLRCRECGRDYPLAATHVCEYCFGPVDVTYDYDVIKKNVSRQSIEAGPASLWRYSAGVVYHRQHPVAPDRTGPRTAARIARSAGAAARTHQVVGTH